MYATMLAQETVDNYNALMASLTSNAFLQGVLGVFMDWQYSSYLSTGLPQDFVEEMQGVKDAAAALGQPDLFTFLTRGLVRVFVNCAV